MDILTHTLSGVAIGSTILHYSKGGFLRKSTLLFVSGLGGMLPDFDALSLWSGFDSSLGKMLGLVNSGKEIYFSKFWYSHHGFLHSLFAATLITTALGMILVLLKNYSFKQPFNKVVANLFRYRLVLLGFLGGYLVHLVEDMPTPACVWGGVDLFWPFGPYVGGFGDIWWWNNYDIFLIIVGVILLNSLLLIGQRYSKFPLRRFALSTLFVAFILVVFQIKTRNFDFNYSGHTSRYYEYEMRSKEIQKSILGEKLFVFMEEFDNKIPLNF